MKHVLLAVFIVSLMIQVLIAVSSAQPVTLKEARTVGENWIALTIRQEGSWGGSLNADIVDVQKFQRGDRILGYYCQVHPQGFLVISLHKELVPVVAYSETSNLDPLSDNGNADLIKGQMEDVLNEIERQVGPVEQATTENVTQGLDVTYQQSWEVLDAEPTTFYSQLESTVIASNYQTGGWLLTSSWHQHDPYYQQVPSPPSGSSCTLPHCLAGCGPLMAAQVMHYWAWPPYHDAPAFPYDWPLMVNRYVWNVSESRWEDENGNPLTQAHLNAVARLVNEIGIEAGADYCSDGCETNTYFSSYVFEDILDTFEDHFRYSSNAEDRYRDDYSQAEWFNLIKNQIHVNRPIPYHVKEHHIVCDGWKERDIGGVLIREYHMNYGWDDSYNRFWEVDQAHLNTSSEVLLERIYPNTALGGSLSGTYTLQSFPYRYFDQDASGSDATFSAGQFLQFLPNVSVTCDSTTGGSIRFDGSSLSKTLLFTRGDKSKGISVSSGSLKLFTGGRLTLL